MNVVCGVTNQPLPQTLHALDHAKVVDFTSHRDRSCCLFQCFPYDSFFRFWFDGFFSSDNLCYPILIHVYNYVYRCVVDILNCCFRF